MKAILDHNQELVSFVNVIIIYKSGVKFLEKRYI